MKDVLLFFYDSKKSKIPAPPEGFELVDIDYSGYIEGTFIPISMSESTDRSPNPILR